jgi:signal transduction histidine kinase
VPVHAGDTARRASEQASARRPKRRSGTAPESDQRQEVRRLARRVAELERDRASLERFAAFAAHEVMMPLVMAEACRASILGRQQAGIDAESRAELEALSETVAQTRTIVEALLHAARAPMQPLRREAVDLRAVVTESVRLLSGEIEPRAARILVRPLPVIQADRALLRVVIRNLLSNGLRYGPPCDGVIRVSASRLRGAWRISVTSGGESLDGDDLERIFSPFERARGERRTAGTGLGLAICRELVERHGGAIGVEPIGSGNRFHFTIPD